jgi:hypothetical protein
VKIIFGGIMPKRTPADINIAENFAAYGNLRIPLDEVKRRMEQGEELIYEESLFSDPGDDWTALYFGSQCIGYWEGY